MTKNGERMEVIIVAEGRWGGCCGSPRPQSLGSSRRFFLHNTIAVVLAVGGLTTPAAPSLAGTPAEAEDSTSLFNGRDFTGWRFGDDSGQPKQMPEQWTIEKGVIRALGDGGPILASQWDYEDFESEFEWRATDDSYNADLYVRSGRLLDADPIRLAKGREGGPQETDRGEGQYNAVSIGGGGRGRVAVPQMQKPLGEWNSWRIKAQGGTIALWCNGQQAWKCEDYVPLRGYLGFRVFKGPLELRNLRIRELGFRSLMSLAEWEVYPGFGGGGPIEASWRHDGDLWVFKGAGPSIVTRKKDYRSYHLRLEFLFSAPDPTDTNSGIYLRGVHPWQAEIWQHKWGCGLWGLRHGQPDLGKAVRPLVRMDNPPGQWNYMDVLVENSIVSVWLNGRTTIDRYAMKTVDPRFPDSGGIALQSHGDGKEIRFRNIRVKTLE